MQPAQVVEKWVDAFNAADVEALSALYADRAVNHQVVTDPVEGREAIREMFAAEFQQAEMVCIVERLYEDGEWAIMEWRDPQGLRGCGFFHVVDGQIHFQRGYWDRLTFLRQNGLPIPTE
ncbi:MAG: nuclear transport factor 2 family protein [Planctomycetota bacterium]